MIRMTALVSSVHLIPMPKNSAKSILESPLRSLKNEPPGCISRAPWVAGAGFCGPGFRNERQPFLFVLLVLVRLVQSAFAFPDALAQPLGNLRQFLTAEAKEGEEQHHQDCLHPSAKHSPSWTPVLPIRRHVHAHYPDNTSLPLPLPPLPLSVTPSTGQPPMLR